MSTEKNHHAVTDISRRLWLILVCCVLVVMTAIAYWQVTRNEFISFDDDIYVTENRHIQDGLTREGLAWSFSFDKRGTYWHPLTWLSHMIDCHFFGLDAGMHHLTNLILHCLNVLLLFAVLFRMTGTLWRSAFVSAIFAVHPINVDSVAWIAERKNLLSTSFWLGTMLAYAWYALRPDIVRYSVTLAIFVLGLLAKPMLVTLPFVFLLLDWWPLGRLRIGTVQASGRVKTRYVETDIKQLIYEKIPFLFFSFLSIVISSASLKENETIISFARVHLDLRIANAVVSYVKYLGKLLWPQNLSIYYPFPAEMLPLWQVVVSTVLLLAISAVALYFFKRRAYIITGWCLYLGTLVPVSGLMQGGLWPAMADRWTYVPFIGLYILISWGLFDLCERLKCRRIVLTAGAMCILIALSTVTQLQIEHWEDNFTIYGHAIDVTKNNNIAHYNLGKAYHDSGNYDEALKHYSKSLQISPQYLEARINLGVVLEKQGKLEAAMGQYRAVLSVSPFDIDAHNNLGLILAGKGKLEDAKKHYGIVLAVSPYNTDALNNLGTALYKQGRIDEAIKHYSEAIRINPSYVKSYNNMGIALFGKGKYDDAIGYFREALRMEPDQAVHKNLAKSIEIRDVISKSKPIAEMKNELKKNPDNAETYIKLGDLYLQAGAVTNARQHYMTALSLNPGIATGLQRQAAAWVAQRNYGRAIAFLQRLVQFDPDNPDVYYNIACVFSLDEKNDQSLQWLEKAIEKGFINRKLLMTDNDLANIRDSESFKKLVNSIPE